MCIQERGVSVVSVHSASVSLAQLVDLEELQSIQDNLASVSGLSIVIFDASGKPLTKQSPPYVGFCEKVIRSTAKGRMACLDCDAKAEANALSLARRGQLPEVRRCHAGLRDFVAPIIIDRSAIGYLWCGRVRAEEDGEIDASEHTKRARRYGIKPERYLAALHAVPVLPESHIQASAQVLYQVARAIASQAYGRLGQEQRADKASQEILQQAAEARILHRAPALLTRGGDPRAVLTEVLQEAKAAIDADCLSLYIYDSAFDRFEEPLTVGVLHQKAMRGPTTERSVVRAVLNRRRPYYAEHAPGDTVVDGSFVHREGITSSAAFPLRVGQRRVGVLFVNFRTHETFPQERRQVLAALATQVALAIDYDRVVKEVQAKAKQITRLHTLATSILRGSRLRDVFEGIVHSALVAFGFDGAALYLVDEEHGVIRGTYAEGDAAAWLSETVRPLDSNDIVADIWRKGRTEVTSGWDERFDSRTFQHHRHKDWVRCFVPIKCTGAVVGVLEAGYLAAHKPRIDREEIRALDSFVHQAAIAIRNGRQLSENRAQLRIARALARGRDSRAMLSSIVRQIRKVVPATTCSVYVLEKQSGHLRPCAADGLEAPQMLEFELEPGRGVTWAVFESGQAEIVNVASEDPRRVHIPGTRDEEQKECLLVVPIRSRGRHLGTINLNRYGVAPFIQHDLEWVTTVADQVGVALERSDLLERYQKLGESARAIAERLELREALQRIAELAADTLDVPIVGLMLRAEDGSLPLLARVGLGTDFQLPEPLSVGKGLSGFVAAERRVYQTEDMSSDPLTAHPDYLKQLGHVSYLGAPMIHRGQLVGVLNVHTKHPRVFGVDEVGVFTVFADLAAAAVSNSLAFDQAAREFAVLSGAGRAVGSAVGLDQVLDHLLREGCALVRANTGCVRTVDQARDRLVPRRWWPKEAWAEAPTELRMSQGISGQVWETGQPNYVPCLSRAPHCQTSRPQAGSALAVPILAGDQVTGVLDVYALQPNAFKERDQRVLVALANLSWVAIEKSMLLGALRAVAEAALGEEADFFGLLIGKTRDLVRVLCETSIWLLDEPNHCLYYAAGEEGCSFAGCPPLPLDGSVSGEALRTGRAVAVAEISKHPVYYHKPTAAKAGLRSLLSVPILAGDDRVGVLNVHTRSPHEFTEWEMGVLSAFAAQAGAAIRINRTVSRLRLLQRYVEALASAENLAEVSGAVARHTREAVGADVTCLWLYDRVTDSFHPGGSHGLAEEELRLALPRPKGMSREMLTTGQSIIVPDVAQLRPGRAHPLSVEMGIRAMAGFPMLAGGRGVGALYVDFRQTHHYTPEEIEVLSAMARLAAVALENARSVQARQDFLVTVSHDLKAPLSAIDVQFQRLELHGYRPDIQRKIYGEIRRLTHLVENLTGLLRAEYAAKPLRRELVELTSMLTDVEAIWSAWIEKRGLAVHTHVTQGAKTVWSDAERVRSIVFNLLDNAVKFARRSVYVRVEKTPRKASFTITVADDGPGMASAKAKRFRLVPGQIPGPYWEEMRTGVGYAAVRRFTADMGGEVSITGSRKGTTVTVRLPFLTS
jgi:GAF domain-containing protein/ligand-binding sensor protein/anti-sigma regulatory factor (Ser/Thr protein kinase)